MALKPAAQGGRGPEEREVLSCRAGDSHGKENVAKRCSYVKHDFPALPPVLDPPPVSLREGPGQAETTGPHTYRRGARMHLFWSPSAAAA